MMNTITTKPMTNAAGELSEADITDCLAHLKSVGRALNTIAQYRRTLLSLQSWMEGRPLTPELLADWKNELISFGKPSSVNVALAAVNNLIHFMKDRKGHDPVWDDVQAFVYLKIQRKTYCEKDTELEEAEYRRIIAAAREQGDEKAALILETLCALGIRVSELAYITADAVRRREAVISMKGKIRTILIPNSLALKLRDYTRKNGIRSGAVFVTRSGRPDSRNSIWKKMKKLAVAARVDEKKVFPHNLRHLFARTHYRMFKDITRLADLLGHSSLNTTRIYLLESGKEHVRQLEQLGRVLLSEYTDRMVQTE